MLIKVDKYLDEFIEKTAHVNYMRHGAFKSELYIIFCLYKHLECNLFIESGLCFGVSTNTLLSLITDDYIGIDIDSNCPAAQIKKPNFRFVHGSAEANIFSFDSDKTIFVFIDGPKGKEAVALKDKLLDYSNVKVVAIHDTYEGLEDENHLRVFETRSNKEYNEKYFSLLNQKGADNISTIYNTEIYDTVDGKTVWRKYCEWYPTGPGLSVYSKLDLQFVC